MGSRREFPPVNVGFSTPRALQILHISPEETRDVEGGRRVRIENHVVVTIDDHHFVEGLIDVLLAANLTARVDMNATLTWRGSRVDHRRERTPQRHTAGILRHVHLHSLRRSRRLGRL